MAKESINEIIGKEGFEQIDRLYKELGILNTEMNKSIVIADTLNKSLSGSSSAKETATNVNAAAAASDKLNTTNSKRLEVERKIKEEGEKMAAQVKAETNNFEQLNAVLEKNIKTQNQTSTSIARLQETLEANKNALKLLNEEYKNGKISSEDYIKSKSTLIQKQTDLKQSLSEEQRNLKLISKDLKANEGSYNQMAARLTQLKTAYRSLSEEERNNINIGGALKKEINNLDESLKGMDKSIGDNQRNVGNYEVGIESLMGRLPGFGGMLGQVASSAAKSGQAFGTTLVTALKSVGKAMLMLMANPLIALIAVIAALIMGIVAAIKRNEDQVNRLKQAFAPLAGLLDITLKILGKVADALIVIIEKALKGIGVVMKLMEKIPFVGEEIAKVNKEIEDSTARANNIEQERQRIKKEDRQELVQIAKWEKDISKLRNEAKMSEQFTDAQRIAKLKEAIRLETEILKIKKEDAIEQENLLKMEIASGKDTEENRDALAQATADRYNAEKEFYDGTRRMETELNNMMREAAEERKRKEEERLAYIKSLNDEIKSLTREHLREIDKLRNDMSDAQTWRDEELKKHPRERAEIEMLYALKVDKLNEEYNNKELDRLNAITEATKNAYDERLKALQNYYDSLEAEIILSTKNDEKQTELIRQNNLKEIDEELSLLNKKEVWGMEEDSRNTELLVKKDQLTEQSAEYIKDVKKRESDASKAFDKDTIDSENALKEARKQSAMEAVSGFASLGSAIAANIKDEKERMRVEAAIALVQSLVNEGVAIAQVINDEGDPYTKAFRIAANVAAITAAMVTATAAFSKASSAMPYAEGTDYHKGGNALVGEKYEPELVLLKNQKPLVVDKPTFFKDMPIGSKVIPFSKIGNDNMMSMSETNELLKSIRDKQTVSVNVNEKITTYLSGKFGYTKILNSKFKV